jgi:hypothetical protein
MGDILDGWHDWTKPYKGLQVQVLHNKVLECSQMKMHVVHCQHAKACQALFCM